MSKFSHAAVLVSTLLIGSLTACGTSPPTRLYIIEPMSAVDSARVDAGPSIAVGPISLPEYLDRKEILTHDERYRVNAAEFDRWAEPLDHSISAALAENLSILVPTDQVVVYPLDSAHTVDYTIALHIITFGTEPSGEVVLKAFYVIYDAANVAVARRKARYSEQRRGNNVIDTVAAMSRAIEQLSRNIADAIKAAPPKQ